jgi:hypothetical protein
MIATITLAAFRIDTGGREIRRRTPLNDFACAALTADLVAAAVPALLSPEGFIEALAVTTNLVDRSAERRASDRGIGGNRQHEHSRAAKGGQQKFGQFSHR